MILNKILNQNYYISLSDCFNNNYHILFCRKLIHFCSRILLIFSTKFRTFSSSNSSNHFPLFLKYDPTMNPSALANFSTFPIEIPEPIKIGSEVDERTSTKEMQNNINSKMYLLILEYLPPFPLHSQSK